MGTAAALTIPIGVRCLGRYNVYLIGVLKQEIDQQIVSRLNGD
jgi:hypothetical protein